jgi:glycosyltransferase involved in cell wall biosynthesis
MRTTATVIIPSYNSAKTIRHTLDGLLAQGERERIAEIIVVDSSDDGLTKGVLEEYANRGVLQITSGIRVMPAKQRNIGARHATGNVLLFIDSDAYPAPGWLSAILKAYDAGCMVGGGGYLLPETQRDNRVAIAQYYLEFNEYIAGEQGAKKMLPTCNLFCDRALFLELGGIPEIRASEDTLFGIKVSKRHAVTYLPDAKVFHIFRENYDHYLENQRLLGKYIYVYRKHVYNNKYLDPKLVQGMLPLFLAVKLARIAPRIVQAGPQHWGSFAKAIPEFVQGLRHWGKGFVEGSTEYDTLARDFGDLLRDAESR